MKKIILLSILFLSINTFAQNKCKGVKKDSTACKMTDVNPAGYCRFHNPDAPRCTYIKKDKERCKMLVRDQQLFCRYHVDGKPQKIN